MFICYNMLFDKARVNLDVARLSRRRSGHDLLREAFEVTADAGLKLCVTVDKVLQSQLMEDREQEEALDPVSDPMSDVVDGERDGGVMRGRRTAGSSSSGSPGTTSGGEETMYHDGGEEQLRDDDDDYAFQVGPPQVRFLKLMYTPHINFLCDEIILIKIMFSLLAGATSDRVVTIASYPTPLLRRSSRQQQYFGANLTADHSKYQCESMIMYCFRYIE